VTGVIKYGIFRRKVEFRFDLAALKAATQVAKLDIGEFYTDLPEEHRLFYHSYGAWLNGREHELKLLQKFTKMFTKFTVIQINEIRNLRNTAEVISEQYREALKKVSEKKNP
jgi:hypothetical protein